MSFRDAENVVVRSVLVARDVETSFRVWTQEIDRWWPKTHSMSGDADTTIFLEAGEGGRIYERTPQGAEFTLGEVLEWDPPHWLSCTWHLGSGQGPPTRVSVRFSPEGGDHTRVQVEHRGPEFIGDLWYQNRSRYGEAWEAVLSAYKIGMPTA